MLLASQQMADFETEEAAKPRSFAKRVALLPVAPIAVPVESIPPSRYAGSSNRTTLALIAALHVVAIALFMKYDVLDVARKTPEPVMIELQPLTEARPPRQQKPQESAKQVQTPIVSPPPIVRTPSVAVPVATVPVTPPSAPQTVAAPAVPAPAAVIATPIVPPDGSAANLGNASPRYPVESRRAHEEGTVRLRVLISPEGAVEEIGLARTSGYDRLDKAALEAVRKWRFRPGTQAGKPVEAVGYLSIPFVLSH